MANREKLQEFISYRDTLEKGRIDRSTEMFFNDSAVHEEFVMKELFANAVESTPQINTIYMYCGSMSAFREGAKEMVDDLRRDLLGENATQNELSEWRNNFDPYAKMIERMKDFFEKGGRLEVIVDDDITGLSKEQIWRDTLSYYYYETKQLTIARLSSNCGIKHFIVSGKAYRSELSHKEKTAMCCFNDADYSGLLYSNFAFLSKSSHPIVI